MKNILVLDDQKTVTIGIKTLFRGKHNVFTANTYAEAEYFLREKIHLALLDINLDSGNKTGINFLQLLKQKSPYTIVLMLSSVKDVATIVKTMKLGAHDFIEKPYDAQDLLVKVECLLSTQTSNKALKRAHERDMESNILIGNSGIIQEIKNKINKIGPMRLLILGETGVGKTPVARYSNECLSESEGVERPFERLNCSHLDKDKFIDRMFGHVKGAFTSADKPKPGLVELADGGDLMLDEVAELNLECQAMLITFLDDYRFSPLGEEKKSKVDIRIISATNKNLQEMVKNGTFRDDLYSRISQETIHIPPLRERKDEIKELFEHFVFKYTGCMKDYDPKIINTLEKFDFEEGNVRELEQATEYMCHLSRNNSIIALSDLPDKYSSNMVPEIKLKDELEDVKKIGFSIYVEGVEKAIIKKMIEKHPEDNTYDLAKEYCIPRSSLRDKIKKYKLT